MKMFAYPAVILAAFAVVACAGCDDPIAKALGLGSGGCKCSPSLRTPALPSLPETPAPAPQPKRRPCPGPGPCPLNHAHLGATK